MRVGLGFDAHRFGPGRRLVLGGVELLSEEGLEGHSDGDVLLHAIADALLGAAGLGDLGVYFPSDRSDLKGISSLKILQEVDAKLKGRGLKVCHMDCIVIAQKPKLQPVTKRMREMIARTLGIGEDRVNIKATTTDHLGFTGREEGIAAQAVVLVEDS